MQIHKLNNAPDIHSNFCLPPPHPLPPPPTPHPLDSTPFLLLPPPNPHSLGSTPSCPASCKDAISAALTSTPSSTTTTDPPSPVPRPRPPRPPRPPPFAPPNPVLWPDGPLAVRGPDKPPAPLFRAAGCTYAESPPPRPPPPPPLRRARLCSMNSAS